MAELNRRDVLKGFGLGAAVTALGPNTAWAQANRKVVLGIIGPGGMGSNHTRMLSKTTGVEIAWVCDVDATRAAEAAKIVQDAGHRAPKVGGDLRRVLDDAAVDAVIIATPDHWHAPAAILALEAGKNVYVEKPCAHNIREGRLMIEAAKRSGKLLEVGTQSRSTEVVADIVHRIHSGAIGEVLVAKSWNSQKRRNIGKAAPSDPPRGLDFDTWCGPAPMVPYRSNLLHSSWRWFHDFGCGDIGNDGVHDIDVALWGLGVKTHPSRISCMGGKYFFDDDQQFPDTQYAVFEYATDKPGVMKQLIFEQRIWSPYVQEGYENGAAFYGTEGMVVMGHSTGWKLYGPKNKLIAERVGPADLAAHHKNFLSCLCGEEKTVNAPAEVGHLAASLCHLANIASRVGRVIHFDPSKEKILNDSEAGKLVRRKYREGHWAVPKGV